MDNQGVATVIKDWSYDYPSREYTITTDSNNTVTITCGDENVTIQEGYTIYECSRCREQNRTTSGVGPPPSGGGDSPGREQEASI